MHCGRLGCISTDLHHFVSENYRDRNFFRYVSGSRCSMPVRRSRHGRLTQLSFISLVLFMVPPSGIVFIFILGAFTLILGMALGWAWGVIAMKAALAARPAAETNAQLQALGQEAYSISNSTGQPLASVQQVLVYEGWMLDVRVSVIYFSLICLMVYLLVSCRLSSFETELNK